MKVVIAFFLAGSLLALDVSAQTQDKTEDKAAAGGGKTPAGSVATAGDGPAAAGGVTATAVTLGTAAASVIAVAFGKSASNSQRK